MTMMMITVIKKNEFEKERDHYWRGASGGGTIATYTIREQTTPCHCTYIPFRYGL